MDLFTFPTCRPGRLARQSVLACLSIALAWPAQPQTTLQRPPTDLDALCNARAEQRQLDFWLGNWDVFDNGQKVAESSIQRLPGSCAILESYSQPDGYSGKSINFFDSTLRKWRQTWVDRVGTVSEFTGELQESAMRLEGQTHTRDGKLILRKMTLTVIEPGRVRQYSERSGDGGKTWGLAYDYVYLKR